MRPNRPAAIAAAIFIITAATPVMAQTPTATPTKTVDAVVLADASNREESFRERMGRLRALRRIAFEQQDQKRVAELDRLEVRLQTLREADHRRLRKQLSPKGRRSLEGALRMSTPDSTSGRRRPGRKRTPPGALGLVAKADGSADRRPVKKRTRLDSAAQGPSFAPPADATPDRRPAGPKRRPPSAGADASMTGSSARRNTRRSAAITPGNAEAEFARLRAEIKSRR
ncbi:MAG: hypothetical protein HKO59_05320 [Phycisphaerales bacterium]|nr:hypothetical protein [Phycisphaerales bacterium]NNM25394.1 hypothetical protein [Phycisphaerales bacterium]